jgi:hypothetical protein
MKEIQSGVLWTNAYLPVVNWYNYVAQLHSIFTLNIPSEALKGTQ